MKRTLFLVLLLSVGLNGFAQSFNDSIRLHRQHYKQEFMEEERSPLKGDDTAFLRFYKADKNYRVVAKLQLTPDSKPFEIPTHSGKKKNYREYGVLSFRLHKKEYRLHVYQSIDLMQKEEYKDHLFIPFNDLTNYETTYAGGRYIDITIGDIKDNTVLLDFNKCYNPYCAYAGGYNCPIPPGENKLKVRIEAGEKLFGKEVEE